MYSAGVGEVGLEDVIGDDDPIGAAVAEGARKCLPVLAMGAAVFGYPRLSRYAGPDAVGGTFHQVRRDRARRQTGWTYSAETPVVRLRVALRNRFVPDPVDHQAIGVYPDHVFETGDGHCIPEPHSRHRHDIREHLR